VRFHDLRHTLASHLIIDLGLDVAQVSRILGHASVTTTLNIHTRLFDDARHATEIRTRMAASPFARLLEPDGEQADNVVAIARRRRHGAARRRRVVERVCTRVRARSRRRVDGHALRHVDHRLEAVCERQGSDGPRAPIAARVREGR
jgi:hypothetical protein